MAAAAKVGTLDVSLNQSQAEVLEAEARSVEAGMEQVKAQEAARNMKQFEEKTKLDGANARLGGMAPALRKEWVAQVVHESSMKEAVDRVLGAAVVKNQEEHFKLKEVERKVAELRRQRVLAVAGAQRVGDLVLNDAVAIAKARTLAKNRTVLESSRKASERG